MNVDLTYFLIGGGAKSLKKYHFVFIKKNIFFSKQLSYVLRFKDKIFTVMLNVLLLHLHSHSCDGNNIKAALRISGPSHGVNL